MLSTLRIKNLALAENVRLDFEPGLNVITGETGAGKSILIGALSLLLGERADRKYIRTGEDSCGAEALFELADDRAINALLEEQGLTPCENKQLIIRRIVRANGSGQNLVNDSPVTLQALKKLGELLVDMHGPHDHQSLLSPAFQLSVLDAYGQTESLCAAYREVYEQWQRLCAERETLAGGPDNVAEQMDLLAYRIKEIEELAPEEGEEERVQREHALVSHAQRILELGAGLSGLLLEGDGSVFDRLAEAQRLLEEWERLMPEAAEWRKEARSAAIQVQELAGTIQSAVQIIEADPARLAWLEQRMGQYQKLRRKYAGTVAETLRILEESRARLRELSGRGARLAALDGLIDKALTDLTAQGGVLRDARKKATAKLAAAVKQILSELGFPHSSFDASLSPAEPRASGLDAVEFGFAPNAGEPMKSLREIASSGEISRVMLAVKAVLAAHDRIPVLIFDEVDANVGGEMGNAIGKKLAGLSRSHQVICITHLPQVAVCGATQFAVTKKTVAGRTISEVTRLDDAARIEEVARMLGGRDLTKVTVQHAREMLSRKN
jgi:DNA repair protein RecN (Recombination protein N)